MRREERGKEDGKRGEGINNGGGNIEKEGDGQAENKSRMGIGEERNEEWGKEEDQKKKGGAGNVKRAIGEREARMGPREQG